MSRPRFARRVRGLRALTLAFAPRLIIQLSGECQFQSRPLANGYLGFAAYLLFVQTYFVANISLDANSPFHVNYCSTRGGH